MNIAIGSDHAGYRYKEMLKERLVAWGHEVRDFGAHSAEPVDYPEFIRPVAEAVASGEYERGLVLGGSGNGEAIVANKVRGVRCALCWSEDTARWSREHNDAMCWRWANVPSARRWRCRLLRSGWGPLFREGGIPGECPKSSLELPGKEFKSKNRSSGSRISQYRFKMKERSGTAMGKGGRLKHGFTNDAQRWDAVLRRDRNADGKFFYSVKTTGVYCRPSCGARRARRENVSFHFSCAEAEKAGFRPCKRCRPNGPSREERTAAAVSKACRLVETGEESPSLASLAGAVGMSTFHFHRLFKKVTGLTPKSYAAAYRAERVREHLAGSPSVTAAIYGAGYNSNSRFYEKASELLGMQPDHFRKGGEGTTIRFAVGESTLGKVLVAATGKGVCAIFLGDDAKALIEDLKRRFPRARLEAGDRDFADIVARVVGLVEAPQLGVNLPLDIRGTAFQQRVWKALLEIPAGKTATYTDVAKKIGMTQAVRAVAQACGANPIAIAIPCHRVVRSDGSLSGYRWGVDRKRALLQREAPTAQKDSVRTVRNRSKDRSGRD